MFSVKQAGRLLRAKWTDPSQLARELYEIVVSPEPKVVDAPVEIRAPRGQTALRLSRGIPDAPAAKPPGVPIFKATPQDRAPGPPGRKLRTVIPPAPRALTGTATGPLARNQPHTSPIEHRPTAPIRSSPAPANTPRSSNPSERPPNRVQFGPDSPTGLSFSEGYHPSPFDGASHYAEPYQAPLFEVADTVKIEPGRPVQFDQPPLLLDPATSQYQPFGFQPRFTKIPREHAFDFWFGQVDDYGYVDTDENNNPRYKVDLYPTIGSDVENTVVVTMWGMDPLYPLAIGSNLWPIWQNPVDGNYYCVPDANLGIAQATGTITERTTTAPGYGPAQLYEFSGGVFVPGITGNVSVYSISGHPSSGSGQITSGTWMIVRRMFGAWFVVAADCSGAP